MKFKKLFAIILTLSLILTLAVGCNSTETKGNVNGGKVQGVTKDKILIGNSAATSGAFAPIGLPFIHGIEAYLEYVNSQGGIDGRQIDFVHYDDEFDPANTTQYLEKLVDEDQVFAVVGHFGSPCVAATIQDLEDKGIPSVYFATGIGALYSEDNPDRNIYPVQPIYPYEGKIMAAYAKGYFKAKSVAIIYTNNEAGIDTYEGVLNQFEQYSEIKIVAEEAVAPGLTDATAQVLKIKEANPDVIIIPSLSAELAPVLKTMEQQGVTEIPIITTYSNVSSVFVDNNYNEAPNTMNNLYGLGWVDLAGNSEEWDMFSEYMDKLGYGDELNAYSATGWICGTFFTTGVQRVSDAGKELTWETYMDALEEAPIMNPFGGSIDFANGMRTGTQQMVLARVDTNEDSNWINVTDFNGVKDFK